MAQAVLAQAAALLLTSALALVVLAWLPLAPSATQALAAIVLGKEAPLDMDKRLTMGLVFPTAALLVFSAVISVVPISQKTYAQGSPGIGSNGGCGAGGSSAVLTASTGGSAAVASVPMLAAPARVVLAAEAASLPIATAPAQVVLALAALLTIITAPAQVVAEAAPARVLRAALALEALVWRLHFY